MKHLLSISDLSKDEIVALMDTADRFRESLEGRSVPQLPTLRGTIVYTLFYENSTRTRTSFELAARRMSADVFTFAAGSSSASASEVSTASFSGSGATT